MSGYSLCLYSVVFTHVPCLYPDVFTDILSFLRNTSSFLRTLCRFYENLRSFYEHFGVFANTNSFLRTPCRSVLLAPSRFYECLVVFRNTCRFVVLYYGHLDVFTSARLVEFFRTPCRLYECLVVCTSASSFLRTPCCFSEHPVVVRSNMWFL